MAGTQIYKKLLKLNNKHTPVFKYLNRHLTKNIFSYANNHMKVYATYFKRELQLKQQWDTATHLLKCPQ